METKDFHFLFLIDSGIIKEEENSCIRGGRALYSLKNKVLGSLVLISFLLLFSLSSPAYAKEYEISNYDVSLQVSEEGDFLVEERITFHFIEGDFSYAYREVKGNVFTDLEFVSIEGLNVPIRDYELREGRNLRLKWYYDQQGRKEATFVFRYIGRGGLQSIRGENVINWTPTGADWDVPIRDLDVRIRLPWTVEVREIKPAADLVARSGGEYHFHKEYLASGKAYILYLTFPKQVAMTEGKESYWQREDIYYLLVFIFAGLILMIMDLMMREKIQAREGAYASSDLLIYEKALLLNHYDTRSSVMAQLYELAKKGKIKFHSSLKKTPFLGKQAEVTVEILDREGVSRVEEEILNKLAEENRLEKFFQDYRWFSRMDQVLKSFLEEKNFISQKARYSRKRTALSSFLFLLPATAIIIAGAIYSQPLFISLAIALYIISLGRLIKAGLVNILTPEALYLQKEIRAELDEKKGQLESFLDTGDNNRALEYFFQEIEYIILHNSFNGFILERYKQAFRKADEIKTPAWLEMDLAELGRALDTLEMVDLVDYMVLSTVILTTNIGSYPGTPGGMGGGTAGGGGGGAG